MNYRIDFSEFSVRDTKNWRKACIHFYTKQIFIEIFMCSCNLTYLAHAYRSLYHEYSLFPESAHKLIHIDGLLRHDALQHVVQCDKCACPAHTCTAVDHHEVLLTVGVGLAHTLDEVDHGGGISRHPVVWPAKIVEQSYFLNWSIWFVRLIQTHAHAHKKLTNKNHIIHA